MTAHASRNPNVASTPYKHATGTVFTDWSATDAANPLLVRKWANDSNANGMREVPTELFGTMGQSKTRMTRDLNGLSGAIADDERVQQKRRGEKVGGPPLQSEYDRLHR